MTPPNDPTEIGNSAAWIANRPNSPSSTPISITGPANAYYLPFISLRTLSRDRPVRTIGDRTVKSEPKNSPSQPKVVRSQPREKRHDEILSAGSGDCTSSACGGGG